MLPGAFPNSVPQVQVIVHTVILQEAPYSAVAGPVPNSRLIQTGSNDRALNMQMFTQEVLKLFLESLNA